MAFLFNYSEPLRRRLIVYFKSRYGLDITNEQANEYLDSLAKLCDWFEKHYCVPREQSFPTEGSFLLKDCMWWSVAVRAERTCRGL